MTSTDPAQLLPDLDRLRARVRADQRATSAPMLVFGALIVAYAAIGGLYAGQLHAGGRHLTLLVYWPLATMVGLVALWWSARRRAGQDGVGEGQHTYRSATRAYLVALALILVLFLPVLFIGVFIPLIWPAAVLLAIASWQRNRPLGSWGAAIGLVGGAEGMVVLANPDLSPGWWWLQPVVYTALGLALVAGALVIRRRERAGG
ncbi:hypothetical protein BH11ACT1_BH11ACT1_16260 [soil metagenome]